MDISRPENWLHPAMPMDAALRPGPWLALARDYVTAFAVSVKPALVRIGPILLKSLVFMLVVAVIALIVWVLQADTSATGLASGNPWSPNANVLLTSGK